MALTITLPDGNKRDYEGPVTGHEVAQSIAPSLAKKALAVTVDGALTDLHKSLEKDCTLNIIRREDEETLGLLRHDCAHIMAEAVQKLFPRAKIAFGPAIEDGFYYDFECDNAFTPDDFPAIEKEMTRIIAENKPFTRKVFARDEAVALFKQKGENLKAEHISAIPAGEDLTIYEQGDWLDLCRGPHAPSTGSVGKGFKLLRVSGAYWKGEASGPKLQRIYGTCWRDVKELEEYLVRREEAEKRDHRKLGRSMSLFHMHEEALGSVFWHEKGWQIFLACEAYMRRKLDAAGYDEVKTPQMLNRSLWEKSGHWSKFRENMFLVENEEDADPFMALKPMNCPGHVHIFNQGIKSYRDLPLRISEFGQVLRNEPSGALLGLMRVRAFTQDDGHIFCTEEQIISESRKFCDLLIDIYKDFGFEDVSVKFSDRPPVRAGTDDVWDQAEKALKEATEEAGLPYSLNPGEGAFYGPKLEFVLRDAIGRDWQCGTLQVDFVLPERLDAAYTTSEGERKRPVMLHRAIFGSVERFIGILLEHYFGNLPLWLAPVQIVLATVTNDSDAYADNLEKMFLDKGLRVILDKRAEKIAYKIRDHSVGKIPIIAVLGARESEDKTVTLRYLGGKTEETLAVSDALAMLCERATPPDLRARLYEQNGICA